MKLYLYVVASKTLPVLAIRHATLYTRLLYVVQPAIRSAPDYGHHVLQ